MAEQEQGDIIFELVIHKSMTNSQTAQVMEEIRLAVNKMIGHFLYVESEGMEHPAINAMANCAVQAAQAVAQLGGVSKRIQPVSSLPQGPQPPQLGRR